MTKSKGKLIVFEGLDGSGKSTQARILAEKLAKQNIECFLTKEPSEGDIGKLIKETLIHKRTYNKKVLSSLFVADRLDHILNSENGFLQKLNSGVSVICDRYYFSNYAYDSSHVPLEWLIHANSLSASIAKPDLNIFIDTDPVVCMKRIEARQNKTELYEKLNTLIQVRENFYSVFQLLANTENIFVVDGNRNVEEISDEIWEYVSKDIIAKNNRSKF